MINNLLFNTTKNTCVSFVIYMYSMGVQLFNAFELAFLELCVPSKMSANSMETNCGETFFSSTMFHSNRNKFTMKWVG